MPPKDIERPRNAQPLLDSYEVRLMAYDLIDRQQLTPAQIFSGTGVSARLLDNPGQRLTLTQELALYTNIAQQNNDPTLGIRTGARLPLANYGILGYAMMGSDTVADALQLLIEFAPLVSWASHSQLSTETYNNEACTCLQVFPTVADNQARTLEIECTFASFQSVFNDLLGRRVYFQSVDFQHNNHGVADDAYQGLFQCPVNFDAGRNALLLSRDLLRQRLPHPLPEYRELFRDLCRESMSAVTEDRGLAGSIRAILKERDTGVPDIEEVAAHFNQSSRTLRRHLKSRGLSYRALVDDYRFEEAARLLASTRQTVESIASRLGYADARSFRTAFKRWSGVVPAQFRQQNRTAGEESEKLSAK
jgi:AraC-like DNA-binding protein